MTSDLDDSINRLVTEFRQGDQEAAQTLCNRLYPRLLGIARNILSNASRRNSEPEDAVQSALASFWKNSESGTLPESLDADGLWGLLITMTARKARRHLRRERATKRGGPLAPPPLSDIPSDRLAQGAASRNELSPAETELAANELIDGLSADLRPIAVLRLMEFSIRETAQLLECSERTIDRKIKEIREAWDSEVE